MVRSGSLSIILLLTSALVTGVLSPRAVRGDVPVKIEFARDVLPILKQHCYECHGPTQRLGGFRLDRRRDALRGGSQSNMGAGNANASKLYLRLTGTSVGPRMPAKRPPLAEEQLAIIKAWIDQGIDWPDAYAGEKPDAPINPGAARVLTMLRDGRFGQVQAVVRRDPGIVNRTAGRDGTSVLMYAALYADVRTIKAMSEAGGDPNTGNHSGATPLMWAVDDLGKVDALLAHGANPDAKSEEGHTALAVAMNSAGGETIAKLLIERGARLPVGQALEQLRAMCPSCASLLPPPPPRIAPKALAANSAPPLPPLEVLAINTAMMPPMSFVAPRPDRVRGAVERALAPLRDYDAIFLERTGCVSCHNNSLPAFAQEVALRRGYHIDAKGRDQQARRIADNIEAWRQTVLQVSTLGGQQDAASYMLVGLHAAGYKGDLGTDAMVRFLMRVQERDGRFTKFPIPRPPSQGSVFTTTALSARAIRAYAPNAWRAEAAEAVRKAGAWLATAEPQDTEDRVFQILGLVWTEQKALALERARALRLEQRPDGGWAQLRSMSSDAYATGQALFALSESGVFRSDRETALLRGIAFLLQTQATDGSWHVRSRVPFRVQPQFTLGFPPYGEDTWISAAATSWAAAALARTGR